MGKHTDGEYDDDVTFNLMKARRPTWCRENHHRRLLDNCIIIIIIIIIIFDESCIALPNACYVITSFDSRYLSVYRLNRMIRIEGYGSNDVNRTM